MATDLTLQHVSMSYPSGTGGASKKEIIRDFSLHVSKGSFVTILGGNGSGKSTLMRLIAGLENPDRGEILLDGQRTRRIGHVGLVSQEIQLFPWRTALENVAFGLEVQGVAKGTRRDLAACYLKAFGLEGCLGSYPSELSGGMRQKVAIARTLVTAPDIILMDEPFSALDYQTRTGLQCFLLQLWVRLRETIVFVTHEVEEAVFLSDTIVVISPSPAGIRKIIQVPLPRPRLRTSSEFMQLSAEVLKDYGTISCMGNEDLKKALDFLARHKEQRIHKAL